MDAKRPVAPVSEKSGFPDAKTRCWFKGKPLSVIDWDDNVTGLIGREVSFIVDSPTMKGGSGPFGVRVYFDKKNGNWEINRIITRRMFIGSDKKYKDVLPKVIFDEEVSDWRINLDEDKLAVKAIPEPAKPNVTTTIEPKS